MNFIKHQHPFHIPAMIYNPASVHMKEPSSSDEADLQSVACASVTPDQCGDDMGPSSETLTEHTPKAPIHYAQQLGSGTQHLAQKLKKPGSGDIASDSPTSSPSRR